MEKKILDCGAGGNMPPLGLFYSEGYETYGIELSEKQIELSKAFEKEHNMNLNIDKEILKIFHLKIMKYLLFILMGQYFICQKRM